MSWENIVTPFPQPVIENRGGDGFLSAGLAKTSSVQTCLVF
jgi:hypothetical protein